MRYDGRRGIVAYGSDSGRWDGVVCHLHGRLMLVFLFLYGESGEERMGGVEWEETSRNVSTDGARGLHDAREGFRPRDDGTEARWFWSRRSPALGRMLAPCTPRDECFG